MGHGRWVIGVAITLGLGCGSRGAELTTEQRAQVVRGLNEACGDLWCEGPISLWFHDVACRGDDCVVKASARMSLADWQGSGGTRPTREASPSMLGGVQFGPIGDAPVLGSSEVGDQVVADIELPVQGPVWRDDEIPVEFEERLGEAIDAWRVP
ncbi:MAG: hypothetical protein AAGE52_29515 [Myxococcota bacterium]